ncbi:hypothetical protein TrLO_g13383 [Triparma laevis f. longispina]|uniref:FAD-binding domain-containing protein n=1 Tax=Triparma laevis f. longispina TaxID=1714387 RepID=A0A9W7E169_9STRA|nr:hypothetical protein TrLO_g13383 [Triparma laevis f. longispina]
MIFAGGCSPGRGGRGRGGRSYLGSSDSRGPNAGRFGGRGRGGRGSGGRGKGKPRKPVVYPEYIPGTSEEPSPQLLTAWIKGAPTIDRLLQTTSEQQSRINHIHLSAAWGCLGRLWMTTDRDKFDSHSHNLNSLSQHTIKVITTSSEIRARELANIAHGVSKSGRGSELTSLMDALSSEILKRASDLKPQETANTAWAFAKAGRSDPSLFTSLTKIALKNLNEFNSQELTNFTWAYATVGIGDCDLFSRLANTIQPKLKEFNPQGISNTALAFAKAGHQDADLFKNLAKIVILQLNDFNAQDYANTSWAFAKIGFADEALFSAFAKMIKGKMEDFNAQGLANTVWAFAKAGHVDESLFSSFGKQIERMLDDFNSQDLANVSWAFAKACHPDIVLFSALARASEKCLKEFNVQDLVNTAWAFAKIDQLDAKLFVNLGNQLMSKNLDDLSAQYIANIAWAFAKAADCLDVEMSKQLFKTLAKSAEERVEDFSAQDLADLAWAFANADQIDAKLFSSLANAAELYLDDFNDEELDNAEWAFNRAGEFKIVELLRAGRQRTLDDAMELSNADVDVSKCGKIVVAGGGIGGAAVAVALQKKGFDVVVLESDPSFDARKQGYGLTIQRQDAINAMGVDLTQDDAPSTSHYTFNSQGHILGVFGEAFSGDKGRERKEVKNSGRFMHIPRQMLRSRIIEQIKPGTIRWGTNFKIHKKKKYGVTVELTDGTKINASLLIGSDGIFSTVRRQLNLPGDRLNFCGLIVVLGIVDDAILDVPLTKRRIFETVDGTTRIYAMPFTTTSTMWQLSFPYSEDAAKSLCKDNAVLKAEILKRCEKWHDPIPELLGKTPLDCFSGYPVYDRSILEPEVLRKQELIRRVTLIGDAAHPMTPFKAQGANQAISDAVLLADTLTEGIRKHPADVEQGLNVALPIFEKKMLNRSSRAVIGSREKAKELHSSLALQPARKVQRETDVDMQKVIKILKEMGVGAASAREGGALGLDGLVAEVMGRAAGGGGGEKKRKTSEGARESEVPKKKPVAAAVGGGGAWQNLWKKSEPVVAVVEEEKKEDKDEDSSDSDSDSSSSSSSSDSDSDSSSKEEEEEKEETKATKATKATRTTTPKRKASDAIEDIFETKETKAPNAPKAPKAPKAPRATTPKRKASDEVEEKKEKIKEKEDKINPDEISNPMRGMGFYNSDWHKVKIIKLKKGGNAKVELKGGVTRTLEANCLKRLVWGFFDDDWHKCTVLKEKKSGDFKVELKGGEVKTLAKDCIKPQYAKK